MIFAAYQISCGRWAIYAWEPEAFPLPPVRVVAVITLADANRGWRLDLVRRKAGRRRIGSGQIAHSLKNRAADTPRAMAAARNLMFALPIDVLDQIATHVAPFRQPTETA